MVIHPHVLTFLLQDIYQFVDVFSEDKILVFNLFEDIEKVLEAYNSIIIAVKKMEAEP